MEPGTSSTAIAGCLSNAFAEVWASGGLPITAPVLRRDADCDPTVFSRCNSSACDLIACAAATHIAQRRELIGDMKVLGTTPRAPAAQAVVTLPQPAGKLAPHRQTRLGSQPAWAHAGPCRRCARLELRAAATSGAASPPWHKQDCRLVLEDGSVWAGRSFGAKGTELGEVVFNTSMSGYQVSAAFKTDQLS